SPVSLTKTNTGSLNFLASPTKASVKSFMEEYRVLNKGILSIVRLNQARIGSVTKVVKITPTKIRIRSTVNIPMPGIYRGWPCSSSKQWEVRLRALSTAATTQTIENIAPATGTVTNVPFIR